jgi:hypothetical protein
MNLLAGEKVRLSDCIMKMEASDFLARSRNVPGRENCLVLDERAWQAFWSCFVFPIDLAAVMTFCLGHRFGPYNKGPRQGKVKRPARTGTSRYITHESFVARAGPVRSGALSGR